MDAKSRTFLRVAGLIRQAIVQGRPVPDSVVLPEASWEECLKIARQIRRATALGWHHAASQLRKQLLYQVSYCRDSLHQVSSALERGLSCPVVSAADIYRDLRVLEDEFEGTECDFEAEVVSVTTPSITLEGVYLGPFQIRLDWNRLHESPAYRVVALEPNPASSNDAVTHPHVNDEALCEGEGRRSIGAALAAGRIVDFFLLVSRLLATYSPGQAYVELSDWCGEPCQDCGLHVTDGNRCSCGNCDGLFCSECTSCCRVCDDFFCLGCISQCSSCGTSLCSGCQDACDACQCFFCPECISDSRCQRCREKEESDAPTDENAKVPSDPAGAEPAAA